jgi:flagellar L-ring protein precursor FlgH
MNMSRIDRSVARVFTVCAIASLLSGCNALNRLAEVGGEPPMTTIQNPTQSPKYRPITMPMPRPQPVAHQPNSLWRAGSRAFFKDQRAAQVGDILTVLIAIDDTAELTNTTKRSRANTEDASVSALFGYESSLSRVLPEGINPGSLIDLDSQTSNEGAGTIERGETIELKVAAIISQRLPNGNLVLHGRQEVRVNYEVRELQIAGIIRPEDITSSNTISYEKIAEARIAYGGRGHISDIQQPRYGSQVIDILFPF